MTLDIGYEIQKRVFATLNGDATLGALITGVFDSLPQEQEYPFVKIGDGEITDLETQTTTGFNGEITIDVWDDETTRKTVNAILTRIRDLLHNQDSLWNIADYCMINFRENFRTVLEEPDTKTYHGIIRFEFTLGGNATP